MNGVYGRFQKEIIDSQAFDRMKLEFGYKEFKYMIEAKVKPIYMDLVLNIWCLLMKYSID
jgi:hypothetical protein